MELAIYRNLEINICAYILNCLFIRQSMHMQCVWCLTFIVVNSW